MIAFLYPGQGSQHAGMGAAWRQHESWELVVEANEMTGRDISHLLLEASDDELVELHLDLGVREVEDTGVDPLSQVHRIAP